MEGIEQILQDIYNKRKKQYQDIFVDRDGLEAKADNTKNFQPIKEGFIDEMIAAANSYLERNPSASQDEARDGIKKLIPKFEWLMLDPFN